MPGSWRGSSARCSGGRSATASTPICDLPRVGAVIERLTGVHYHAGHVWYILHGLQWSFATPHAPGARRDESAIRQWVSERWPAVKKTPGAGGLARLRGRKRSRSSRRPAHWAPRGQTPVLIHTGGPGSGSRWPGAGLPLGWAADPLLFPDVSRHLFGRDPH